MFGRENEKNVARTRSCCGWPSCPPWMTTRMENEDDYKTKVRNMQYNKYNYCAVYRVILLV